MWKMMYRRTKELRRDLLCVLLERCEREEEGSSVIYVMFDAIQTVEKGKRDY